MLDNKKIQISFFFILFGLISLLVFQIFQPYLGVIFSAMVFAIVLQPIFKKMLVLSRGQRTVAAIMTILVTCIFIAIPLYLLGVQIVTESTSLYSTITTVNTDSGFLTELSSKVNHGLSQVMPGFSLDLKTYAENIIGSVAENIGRFISGTAFALLNVLFFILTLFFFLKDGPMFVNGFVYLSPLQDKYDKEILDTLDKTTRSMLRGVLAVSIIQGIVLAIGFTVFKVPNAFLWGAMTTIAGVVPGIGTATIFIPGILYLYFSHQAAAAVGLLIWSVFLHGSIDNFVAPMLYGKGMSIHPVFIMFSVLGGLAFFGPLGFLFGPIIFSVFMSLFRIYRLFILDEGHEHKKICA